MTVTLLKTTPPAEPAEMVPRYFDTELIVTPDDNPVYTQPMLADLLESVRQYGQLIPGFVCPSPDLPDQKRLCLEGNRRLAVVRQAGLRFWAFDLNRIVPEEERIRLTFQHNHSRRSMSREEVVQRAERFMELTGCTLAEAARPLNLSGPMLSKSLGERRIPPELRERAGRLGMSIRFLISALPPELMPRVVEYAERAGQDGKKPTRDQVAGFIGHLRKEGKPKGRKPRSIALRLGGRVVTLAINDRDTATTLADDLKVIVAKLGKHADVSPEGLPFLFQ